ncbi:MAG: DUF2203 domain-containing protein [Vampirovibrio sp.]|nr:DUF2203 domain-containing protein [Vampirovibrio sp.]
MDKIDQPQPHQEELFDRYFTLEEAAALIPEVRKAFTQCHKELNELKDQIVLYKRIFTQREQSGQPPTEAESEALHQKWLSYEQCLDRWVQHFLSQGILLKDLEKGLIDFPYLSQDGDLFLLCWHLGEDGIFYFHGLEEGFRGRKPIAVLPE